MKFVEFTYLEKTNYTVYGIEYYDATASVMNTINASDRSIRVY